MKRPRGRHVASGAAIVAILGAAAQAYVSIDQHRLEDAQRVAQIRLEAQEAACADCGGRWYKGSCERLP